MEDGNDKKNVHTVINELMNRVLFSLMNLVRSTIYASRRDTSMEKGRLHTNNRYPLSD
jgi:hypothetical protein